MDNSRHSRPWILLALATLGVTTLSALLPAEAMAATPVTAYVLNPAYAKKIGFPTTAVAAKASSGTDEKNCPKSAESEYFNAATNAGLVSESLVCKTSAAALTAFKQAKTEAAADTSITLPRSLGSSAFATASEAPQYTVVWQHGSKVGVTAIDIDVSASASTESSTTVPSTPLTAAQAKVLVAAAVAQNTLFSK
ncbi:MAG: hypothetical protein ACLQOZ_13040 [Acidimicrobiales bacterium]|jgi:hypothetical protein